MAYDRVPVSLVDGLMSKAFPGIKASFGGRLRALLLPALAAAASALGVVAGSSRALAQSAQAQPDPRQSTADTVPVPKKEIDWTAGFDIDCSHNFNLGKGGANSCIRLTQSYIGGSLDLGRNMRGTLVLAPFAQPAPGYRQLSYEAFPLQGVDGIEPLADYRLAWQARPNLTFAVQQSQGSVVFPSTSGLSMATPFSLEQWYQTALTIAYTLPALGDSKVTFHLGNGEGENGRNYDVQQFFGVDLKAGLAEGLHAEFGMSLDGNTYASAATDEELLRHADCLAVAPADGEGGYETQRLGGGIVLDGTMPAMRGLKAALAFHRINQSDLSQDKTMALPGTACQRLDPDRFFAEDPSQSAANVMTRSVYGINGSYRILDRYVLGIDYQVRKIESEHVAAIDVCQGLAEGACLSPLSVKSLEQSAISFGMGVDLEEYFRIVLDYSVLEYKKDYRQFHYLDRDGNPSKTLEWLNFRVSARI